MGDPVFECFAARIKVQEKSAQGGKTTFESTYTMVDGVYDSSQENFSRE